MTVLLIANYFPGFLHDEVELHYGNDAVLVQALHGDPSVRAAGPVPGLPHPV